jgi:hypothetical protein
LNVDVKQIGDALLGILTEHLKDSLADVKAEYVPYMERAGTLAAEAAVKKAAGDPAADADMLQASAQLKTLVAIAAIREAKRVEADLYKALDIGVKVVASLLAAAAIA